MKRITLSNPALRSDFFTGRPQHFCIHHPAGSLYKCRKRHGKSLQAISSVVTRVDRETGAVHFVAMNGHSFRGK